MTLPKNTRFALGSANKITATATTLINGASIVTYPSRPALSEDAQYPMANLRINDLYTVWRSAVGLTGTYDVEFDFGSDMNLDVFAVLGFRRAAGQASPSVVDISGRTSANLYSAGNTWSTGVGTGATAGYAIRTGLPLTGRHAGLQFAAPLRLRYLRYRFGVGAQGGGFSFGLPFAAPLSLDLGFLYGPGARKQRLDSDRRYRIGGPSGPMVVNGSGDPAYALSLPFQGIDTDLKDALRVIGEVTTPLVHISPFDELLPVLPGPGFADEHLWQAGEKGLWNATLELESLS